MVEKWRHPQWTTVSDQIGCQGWVGGGVWREHYLPETVRNGEWDIVGHINE